MIIGEPNTTLVGQESLAFAKGYRNAYGNMTLDLPNL